MAYNPAPKYAVSKPATKKIQPKKNTGSVSEHGLGQINPVKPPLPHTVEKATKQIAAGLAAAKSAAAQARAAATQTVTSSSGGAPPAAQAPDPGQQGGDDFASFLAQFFQPTAPPDINALIKSYLDPLKEMYGQQNQQISQQSQQQLGFDNTLAMQLGDYLKGIGGSDYTPTMAAALGLEAQRNDRYATSQARSKLWDTIYGSSKSDIAKLITDTNNAYAQSQPSGSDKLAAFKTYSDLGQQDYQNQRQYGLDNAQLTHLQNQDNLASANFNLKQNVAQTVADLKRQSLGLSKQKTNVQLKQAQQRIANQTASATGIDPRTGKPTAKFRAQLAGLGIQERKAALSEAKAKSDAAYKGAKLKLEAQRVKIAQQNADTRRQAAIKRATNTATDKVNWPNLTKAQVMHLRSGIAAGYFGVPEKKDASGKVVQEAAPELTYQQAVDRAVMHGYSRAGATKMANRFYTPGQRGRPKKGR